LPRGQGGLGFGTREGGSAFPVLSVSLTERHRDAALSSATTQEASRDQFGERWDHARCKRCKAFVYCRVGPIDRNVAESRKLYGEGFGISFKEESGGYLHTEAVQGARSFALWPLSQAALSCFGKDSWPDNIPAPQAWLEFEVESVESATSVLESRGYEMLIRNKKEPWGQIVSRFISPEGLLVGVTFTPSMREGK
jgi:hypothetical protein